MAQVIHIDHSKNQESDGKFQLSDKKNSTYILSITTNLDHWTSDLPDSYKLIPTVLEMTTLKIVSNANQLQNFWK